MNALNILLAVLVLIPLGLFFFRRPRPAARPAPNAATGAEAAPVDDMADMNAAFLARAEASGEASVDAVAVYTIHDLTMIRSLLAGASIANFAKNEHMSSLIPGVGIDGLNTMVVTVFATDAAAAEELVADYLSQKKEDRTEGGRRPADLLRNIVEVGVTGRFVAAAKDARPPETLTGGKAEK
jgi:hypothetical protein